MRLNKFLIVLSFLFILILNCSIIAAEDNSQIENQLLEESNISDSTLSNAETIIIAEDNDDQFLNPTVQNAINNANLGDTLVLKGNFINCHFTIDKSLNIIADNATLSPYGENDVFHMGGSASGSLIRGFTFVQAMNPISLNISGASNVVIQDCILDYSSIQIKNSNNVKLSNVVVNNTITGITISDSFEIAIEDSIISNSKNSAISVSGVSNNINIYRNKILSNQKSGICLSAANNVSIINNLIKDNGNNNSDSGSGIYVNTNITKLVVKGNIFLGNGEHAILYDYRCRNLNADDGAEDLTDVDDNYFEGHNSMILHHRIYVERDYGDLKYDAENDVYGSVGEGTYAEGKSYVYMKNAIIFMDTPCGFTYYTNQIPWSLTAPENGGRYDFSLKLNLKQIKNGVYQVSIVDSQGNIAVNFNWINMVFFLNDFSKVQPQEGNIYRNVSIQNGIGIADFREDYDSFKSSGNIITAVFPGLSEEVERSLYTQLNVLDCDIPINPETKLSASSLTTYPLYDSYFIAKLVDSKGQPISGEKITFNVGGKTYTSITDKNGFAKIKLSFSSKKTYAVGINYKGSDDYKASRITSSILVKTGSKKSIIKASKLKVVRNKKKIFQFKLLSGNGKALRSQKVIVKLNGKTNIVKTNSKGIAKCSVKLSKVKKYKITMKFLGNEGYKASSKTTTISVVKR